MYLIGKGKHRLKVKEWKRFSKQKIDRKQAEVAILISDKALNLNHSEEIKKVTSY
jgi:hypothetical protein